MGNCKLLICILIFSAQIVSAGIINGNFDKGLYGWDVGISGGFAITYNGFKEEIVDVYYDLSEFPDKKRLLRETTYGVEDNVGMLESTWFSEGGFEDKWGNFVYYDLSGSTISFSQSVYLDAFQTIEGEIAFDTYDYAEDKTFVSIRGDSYYAKPVEITVDDIFDYDTWYNMDMNSSGWQKWSWTAPASGLYKLSLCNYMNNEEGSYSYFKNIHINNVPEPSTAILFIFSGLCCFLCFGLKRTRFK